MDLSIWRTAGYVADGKPGRICPYSDDGWFPHEGIGIMMAHRQPHEVGQEEAKLACTRCGYDLRNLVGTERCPECGMPIIISRLYRRESMKPSRVLVLECIFFAGLVLAWLVTFAARSMVTHTTNNAAPQRDVQRELAYWGLVIAGIVTLSGCIWSMLSRQAVKSPIIRFGILGALIAALWCLGMIR